MKRFLLPIALLVALNGHAQRIDTLALTPPMGWNTCNTFAGNFNEKLIREVVDLLVSSGMKDAGYAYVIIVDNWSGPRDSLGILTVDTKRFPSGLKALSEYVHSKGLKLELYFNAGYNTCGGWRGLPTSASTRCDLTRSGTRSAITRTSRRC